MIPAYETTESEGETSNRRTQHWEKNNVDVETKLQGQLNSIKTKQTTAAFNKKTTTPSGNIGGMKNNGVKVVKDMVKEIIVKEPLQHLNCKITDKRPSDDKCVLEGESSIKKKKVDASKSMAPKMSILRDKEINTRQTISVPNTKPFRCPESTGLNPSSLLKRVTNDHDNNASQSLQSAKVKIERLMKALKNAVDRVGELKKEKESVLQELQECKGDLKTAHEQIEAMFKELDNVKHLNEEWQKLAINKCEVMHAIFSEWKEAQNATGNGTFAPVGYITEDNSQIHLGRGVWIQYETYLFAINGIKLSTRKRFFRQMSVAVFGYDVLAKSTITGKGSNRNGGTKEPAMRLDPKKIGAIKDIYTHFCVQHLKMDYNEADSEAGEANQSIRKKISQLKELKTKPAKQGRPLLGGLADIEEVQDDEVAGVQERTGSLEDIDLEGIAPEEQQELDDNLERMMEIDIEENLLLSKIELSSTDPLRTEMGDRENFTDYDSDEIL